VKVMDADGRSVKNVVEYKNTVAEGGGTAVRP
jgi:hypothetical protein